MTVNLRNISSQNQNVTVSRPPAQPYTRTVASLNYLLLSDAEYAAVTSPLPSNIWQVVMGTPDVTPPAPPTGTTTTDGVPEGNVNLYFTAARAQAAAVDNAITPNVTLKAPSEAAVALALSTKFDTGVNLGSGADIFAGSTGSAAHYKTLVAGSNVSLIETSQSIFISASGGGGGGGSTLPLLNSTGQALTLGQIVVIASSTIPSLATAAGSAIFNTQLGVVAQSTIAINATGQIATGGLVPGFTGLTAGNYYYVDETAGGITNTTGAFNPGDQVYGVGRAFSDSQIDFVPEFLFEY